MNTFIRQNRKEWLVLTGRLILCAVPVAAGLVRMTQLSVGAEITPANARFFAAPLPVILHIVGLIPYTILGAFQFVPGFRRSRKGWHRKVGWFLLPSGLTVALSGLWMTLTYPWPTGDGVALYWLRIVVGTLMTVSLLLAVLAIQRRNFIQHGIWMLRAYAIGMGAGTQVFTHLPWLLLMGSESTPGEGPRAIMMGAGWLINVLIAEWIIYRNLQRPQKASGVTTARTRFVYEKS